MSGVDYAKLNEHDATLAARVIVDVCYELANLSRFGNLDSKALRKYESLKTNAIIENFMSRVEETAVASRVSENASDANGGDSTGYARSEEEAAENVRLGRAIQRQYRERWESEHPLHARWDRLKALLTRLVISMAGGVA
ncbi:MAG: hypothetical protein LKI98_04175 [Bifidobacterium crudilactis]|jgi:hypothetical protein|nr:hypothetical protein [Bifidobacterium crudilactis]MCI1889617.1 hypothetical protein [Bifidobacterium crudilactis]